MMQSDQAANELTEEQVLDFLVNTLDEEIDIESVDEKIKHLLFGEFVGCLVGLHHPTKQPVYLTNFVKY